MHSVGRWYDYDWLLGSVSFDATSSGGGPAGIAIYLQWCELRRNHVGVLFGSEFSKPRERVIFSVSEEG